MNTNNIMQTALFTAILVFLSNITFGQFIGGAGSAPPAGDIYYNGASQAGIGTTTPDFKFTVANGADDGNGYSYGLCPGVGTGSIGFLSISTQDDANIGVIGFGKADNSYNNGGEFIATGSWTDDEAECVANFGSYAHASGIGLSANEAGWISNTGVYGYAQGDSAYNFGGSFEAHNIECTGASIGVVATAISGNMIVGMYAEAINENECDITDSLETMEAPGIIPTLLAGLFNGDVFAINYWTQSDKNLKSNITEAENASDLLSKLSVKNYKYNREEFPSLHLPKGYHYGLLSQDVEKVLPELVKDIQTIAPKIQGSTIKRESYQIKAVNYDEFIPLLIAAHNEQRAEIENLKTMLKQVCEQGCDKVNFSDDLKQGYYLNTFPNPTENSLQVSYSVKTGAEAVKIELRDINGKLYKVSEFGNEPAGNLTIDVSPLSAGNYYITLKSNGVTLQTNMIAVTR